MSAKIIAYNGVFFDNLKLGDFREDQMAGTSYEKLMEFAGRICYDAIHGKGRNTTDYFENILASEHYSILSHCYITFGIEADLDHYKVLGIEPGVFIVDTPFKVGSPMATSVTINLRALYKMAVRKEYFYGEWLQTDVPMSVVRTVEIMGDLVKENIAPLVFKDFRYSFKVTPFLERLKNYTEIIEPRHQLTAHTFLIECSRSCSHELIRHSYNVGISQESTRYVDKTAAPFINHPLQTKVMVHPESRYKEVFDAHIKDMDKKTARGIAARYLPHGVNTKLVVTYPTFVLDNLFKYRLDEHADAEIRELAQEMLKELKDLYGTKEKE